MKKTRVLIGRAGVRIPFFEKKDVLRLQLIPIDVKTSSAVPTADYINIVVDAAVNVKIGKGDEFISLASMNFLNKQTDYIAKVAREVLEGNMREIVGRMRLEEMVSDRQKFANLVKENAEPDLAAMGLEIVSFNVQNFSDGNGVIDNLGVDNVVRIQKNAAISRAESEKEIKAAQEAAKSEANAAQVKADAEIAQREAELAIKQAQLKVNADKEKAIADAAYTITEEEQRRFIEVKRTEADIAKQEKEADLQRQKALVAEQELDATVRKKADAEKYRREREAEAALAEKQREAEARLVEAQREAEAAKATAEATLYAKQKEAEGIEAVGKAEAAAIQAKGEAEAAAMEKKADAYKKYGQAAIVEMMVKVLPEMAHEVAQAVTTIDKVSIIDGGSGSGVSAVGSWTPQILSKTIEAVKDTTGFDITEVMRAGTYDAKVNRKLDVNGLGAVPYGQSVGEEVPDGGPVGTENEGWGPQDEGPRFEGDHDHVYDKDGKSVHG